MACVCLVVDTSSVSWYSCRCDPCLFCLVFVLSRVCLCLLSFVPVLSCPVIVLWVRVRVRVRVGVRVRVRVRARF